MKSTIRNMSGSNITLPASFGNVILVPNSSYNATYSNIAPADLDVVVNYAKTGVVDFPGAPGFALAGLQVTPALTYVLNGQEPADQPQGTRVYSITDGAMRTFLYGQWLTDGRDAFIQETPSTKGRLVHTSTRLKDGRVMVIGGLDENFMRTSTCEIYNPETRTWAAAAPVPGDKVETILMACCTLKNGKVLLGGGSVIVGSFIPGDNSKCYLYDPETDTWAATGALPQNIWGNAAGNMTVLSSGKVLYYTAFDNSYAVFTNVNVAKKAAVYDPATGIWTATPDLAAGHEGVTSWPLSGNRALICGGNTKFNPEVFNIIDMTGSVEIYNAGANTWSAGASMPEVVGEDDLLPAGNRGKRWIAGQICVKDRLVVAGGVTQLNAFPTSSVIGDTTVNLGRRSILVYNAQTDTWTVATPKLPLAIISPLMFRIDDSRVLIAGGDATDHLLPLYTSYIYNIDEDTLTPAADLPNEIPFWLPPEWGISVPLVDTFNNFRNALELDANFKFVSGGISLRTFTPAKDAALYTTGKKNARAKVNGAVDNDTKKAAIYAKHVSSRGLLTTALRGGH